ncbi:DNA (cytosine-5-)-methyltransferase [Bacteroides acidifaciens]|uniref:DNA (cytosine-5-)-methyltransferase n=1 Tax=Bacteroides acidifaciens TaxID=85831 RepID=UPI0025580344|nr:DNA (cytosine-5-)-methyltransferase [Bacteroides acidifaciens]
MSKVLKFIDLFAGLGGFHLALTGSAMRMSGLEFECVFASELKEDLRTQYQINFPDTEIVGDITQILPSQIPQHDILCAGFPCQPFSQAGKREGFNDTQKRGNLFDNICDIVEYHHPKYLFLENVQNLKNHDNGNTWKVIKEKLDNLGYGVISEILSPHQFGLSQHRKRIFILAVNRQLGDISTYGFPIPPKGASKYCDVTKLVDASDTNITKIKPETRYQLKVWQEFIDQTISHGQKIPSFPIWAMEFGADYEYKDLAPAFQTVEDLRDRRGKLGIPITGKTLEECLAQLPIYAQTDAAQRFPSWKIRYIEQNREFYELNREWLTPWLEKVRNFENSHLKLEWNCGVNATSSIEDKIVQFRASGIRIKLPNFAPALNLVGTQIPILPWVKLPSEILSEGEPSKGRYMTIREAASIQGMQDLKFDKLTPNRTLEALGNAVNVTLVRRIAKTIFNDEQQ